MSKRATHLAAVYITFNEHKNITLFSVVNIHVEKEALTIPASYERFTRDSHSTNNFMLLLFSTTQPADHEFYY